MKKKEKNKTNTYNGYCDNLISRIILIIALCFINFNAAYARTTYTISTKDYVSQQYLDSASLQFLTQKGYVIGIGTIEYEVLIANTDAGWYELWLSAADWPTDIFLDDVLLAHTALKNNTGLPQLGLSKAFNLNLAAGKHSIRFERLYFPGLPYIQSIVLKPSTDISGMVQATSKTDALVFRSNEAFPLNLVAGQSPISTALTLSVRDTATSKIITTLSQPIAGGTSLNTSTVMIPTNKEGVFDLEIKNAISGYVDRTIQYTVVDTKTPVVNTATNISKQLVTTINPTATPPDYSSIQPTPSGVNIESGANGVYENPTNPDYFAYTLPLPDNNGFFLVEVDYPNDKNRAFTISLVDEAANPYALDSGVITGGRLPLTNTVQTSQLFFYARTTNPRLLFLNWHSNQKIGISQIRVYKILDKLPPLLTTKHERKFGTFFEESLRFTTYFGANPTSNEWGEIKKTADRWAEWSRFIGSTVWTQSIANYQSMMWPSLLLPGFSPSEEDGYGLIGPSSRKDPIQKDIIRLLLLTAEKNNISFIGELAIPMSGFIKQQLDIRFGGNGDISHNTTETPWLTVSDRGTIGSDSGFDPYFNPVHPEVQQWVADLITELANRYKDSPAFSGLAIRLMNWSFSSWQAFPSIHWGYEDYTINLFQRDTGIMLPASSGPGRFKQRYDWLIQNHYNEWVAWRCSKIQAFYTKLSNILQTARPGLKLYINAFGPDYSPVDWGQYGGWGGRAYKINNLGWSNVIKESGVDPAMYTNSSNIVLSNTFTLQPGVKATGSSAIAQEQAQWQEANDPAAIVATAKISGQGLESSVGFINNYMEYDFPITNIGYSKLLRNNLTRLRISGALVSPGKLILSPYLNAMAAGNITFISDGGLGYILGQPNVLRPFLKEYYSLPKIGMQKVLGTGNSVTLWYGNKNGVVYYYVVNNTNNTVNIKINFSANTNSLQLTSNLGVNTDNLFLQPYSLMSLKTTTTNSIPVKVSILSIQ
ncbi:MAG: family 10 glycosylhydrolase [Methylococcaceae bacterium]